MVSVIRDTEQALNMPEPRRGGIWKLLLVLLVVLSLLLSYLYYGEYGRNALFVFGGLGFIGFVLFLLQVFRKPDTAAFRVAVPVSNVLERVFARSAYAGLIVEEGRAVRANDSYLELAETFGFQPTDDVPPLPETLFRDVDENSRAIIYRLSHLTEAEAFGEEEIEIWTDDDQVSKYLLRVTVFRKQQFWEIIDLTLDLTRDGRLLSQAPVGLFAITETGGVISANKVLREWLGVQEIDGLKVGDFIERPDGLLDSPKEVDRYIRFDTRLITQKNVATPIVLVANWNKSCLLYTSPSPRDA